MHQTPIDLVHSGQKGAASGWFVFIEMNWTHTVTCGKKLKKEPECNSCLQKGTPTSGEN
jgi:hypothetical protein